MTSGEKLIKDIEIQKTRLEESLAKLRKALHYWQDLELDYTGLQEEFTALPEQPSKQQYLDTAHDLAPVKLKDKDVEEIINANRAKRPGSKVKVLDVLDKRLDYVNTNLSSLRRQVKETERQRNELLLALDGTGDDEIAQEPNLNDDEVGVSEILEELDDDGNVVNSRVELKNKTIDHNLLQEKIGGVQLPISSNSAAKASPILQPKIAVDNEKPGLVPFTEESEDDDKDDADDDDYNEVSAIPEDGPRQYLAPTNPSDTPEEAYFRQELLKYANTTSGIDEVANIVAELEMTEVATDSEIDDEDNLSDMYDDSDESVSEDEHGKTKHAGLLHSEAYKRKMEKLQRELDIEMVNAGPTPELSEDLQDALSGKERRSAAEAARQAALKREAENSHLDSKTSSGDGSGTEKPATKSRPKKSVAFAKELDIANEKPMPRPIYHKSELDKLEDTPAPPMAESVVERNTSTLAPQLALPSSSATNPAHPPAPPTQPKKISKFKASRQAQSSTNPPSTTDNLPKISSPSVFPPPLPSPARNSPTTASIARPNPPRDATHASIVSGRTPSAPVQPNLNVYNTTSSIPHYDDDNNPPPFSHLKAESARLRNKIIHSQGGYVQGGEEENYGRGMAPTNGGTVVDEDGKERKVSLFRMRMMGLK